jgi:hypothetical protein
MIMFGSFLPSLLVGFSTTNFTRAGEPTLSWNQLHSLGGFLVSGPQGIDLDSPQLGLRIWPFAERPSSVIVQTISHDGIIEKLG